MADTSTGLQLHYKFDTGSGTTVVDSSGNGNNGNFVGSPVWATGVYSGGVKFDYTNGNDFIEVPNSPSVENIQENNFTLTAWFKPATLPPGTGADENANYGVIIKEGQHSGIKYKADGRFSFEMWHATPASINTTTPLTYPVGTFYHVAGVYDRAAGTISIYIDGVLVSNNTFTPGVASKEYNTNLWRVGTADPISGDYAWPANGTVDDVRIYNRALSAADIIAVKNNESSGTVTHGPFTFATATGADADRFIYNGPLQTEATLPATSGKGYITHTTTNAPSKNVGPDQGQGGTGDGFLFTEASSPGANGDNYYIRFDTLLDASNTQWQFNFYSLQHGPSIGDNQSLLRVQINQNGAGWINVGPELGGSGNDTTNGTAWTPRSVDLSNAGVNANSSTQVRIWIKSQAATAWHGDMGIDTISIVGTAIATVQTQTHQMMI